MPVEGFTANGIPLLGSVKSSHRVQGLAAPGGRVVGGPENLMISSRARQSDLFIHRLWATPPFILKPEAEALGIAHHEFPEVRADEISVFGFEIDTADGGAAYRSELETHQRGTHVRQIQGIDLTKEGSYVRDKTGKWYVHIPLVVDMTGTSSYDYTTIAKWRGKEIALWHPGEGSVIDFTSGGGLVPEREPPKFYVAYIPDENWPTPTEMEEKETNESPEEGPVKKGPDWVPEVATKYVEFPIPWLTSVLEAILGTGGLYGGAGTGRGAIGFGNYRPRPGDLVGRSDPLYGLTMADFLEVDKERDSYIGVPGRQAILKLLQENTVEANEQIEALLRGEAEAKKAKEREELYEILTAFGKGGDFTFNDPPGVGDNALEKEAFEKRFLHLGKVWTDASELRESLSGKFEPFDIGPMPYGARAAAMYGGVDQYSMLFPIADPQFADHSSPLKHKAAPVRLLDKGESMPTTGKLVWGFIWEHGQSPGGLESELQRRGGFPGSFAASVGSAGLVPA